jgi:hypothetical protein
MNKPIVLKKTVEDLTSEERRILRDSYMEHDGPITQSLIVAINKAIELLSKEPERMYVVWADDQPYVHICHAQDKWAKWDNIYIIPPGTVLTDLCRETWEALRDNGELEEIG